MAHLFATNRQLRKENEHYRLTLAHLVRSNINLQARIALLEITIEDSERALPCPEEEA